MKKRIFGVVSAQSSDTEQREILCGIIGQAKKLNVNIAVFSNIYNPNIPHSELDCENEIYELILSNELDGLIVISEAIINPELQEKIKRFIEQKVDLPIVAVGAKQPSFTLPSFDFINTNDENDLECVTDHLIDGHGFTDIDILTGFDYLEISDKRVNGYKKSLEKHNISFDKNKVFYGNFWVNSGQELAQRYVKKELPLPQAVICTNDYMAYGMLDEFILRGVNVPDDVSVVGYDFVYERIYHAPLLTSFKRNRKALGEEAAMLLYRKISSLSMNTNCKSDGCLIKGNSCPCGINPEQLNAELSFTRDKQTADFLNLFSQIEHRLTECKTINDCVKVCRNFRYLIRNVSGIFLCLSENWYETASTPSQMLKCYDIMTEREPFLASKFNLSAFFGAESSAACYFNPLFFSGKTLGYVVLRYDEPNTYDHTFRNWLKSISNALEFLRMKNDIRYLLKCQSLSESRDVLTGLLNENGLKNAFCTADFFSGKSYFVTAKICLFEDNFNEIDIANKTAAVPEIASAMQKFCAGGICGRTSSNTFSCIISTEAKNPEAFLSDRLGSFIMQQPLYLRHYGVNSFVVAAVKIGSGEAYNDFSQRCNEVIEKLVENIGAMRIKPHYKELLSVRNGIYAAPDTQNLNASVLSSCFLSEGHFRALYKNCFSVTFHQDCINSRISRAKYLLNTTALNTLKIAKQCGYNDEKYFLRQFMKETGFTPNEYKRLVR